MWPEEFLEASRETGTMFTRFPTGFLGRPRLGTEGETGFLGRSRLGTEGEKDG